MGGRPPGSLPVLSPVFKTQHLAIGPDHIEEETCRPTVGSSAETISHGRLALHKCIGPGSTESGGKIVDSVFGIAPQEKGLLPHGKKGIPSLSSDFRNRVKGDAVPNGDPAGGFIKGHRRTGKMAESDLPDPSIPHIFHGNGKPAVIFIFGIPGIRFRF
jgi:hypothetical protein